ncbi:MAG: hypothetical protein II102_03520 [Bacteroidales bacterium]|nr:hypothetical protein [Bacteroidales bacterium]
MRFYVHAATGGYAVRSPPAALLPDARRPKRARSPFSGDTLPGDSRSRAVEAR